MSKRMDRLDFDALAERCLNLLKTNSSKSQLQPQDGSSVVSSSGDDDSHEYSHHCQVFIGVAGTPGSGKSYVAEQVRDVINHKYTPDLAIVLPMDGYHYSRAQLKEMAQQGKLFRDDQSQEMRTMTYEELMARRGAPWTFCPKRFIQDLREAKANGEGSFPIYNREQHDPVPDGVFLSKRNKIVLVEGNYLLCLDDPDWKPLGELWDDKWYVDVSLETTKDRLVKRHLKNWNEEKVRQWGEGRQGAEAKTEANDMKNAQCIRQNSIQHANLIVDNNADLS